MQQGRSSSGYRGRWTPRPFRGFTRGGRGGSLHGRPIVSSVPTPPLGREIQSISKKDLAHDAMAYIHSAKIDDCKLVASYNWMEGGKPTILVPGKPAKWTPPRDEVKLQEDSGVYFRDSNAAMFPPHLLESTVLAALSRLPNIPAEVDLVSDVASLGNLLRFVLDKDKTFRVVVQVVEGTVFFVRRENSPTETLDGIRGHGHTFVETHTTWDADVKGSSANHRIMTYTFGGLKMLVRYEADAYIPGQDTNTSQATIGPSRDKDPDLSTLLYDLKASPTTTTQSPSPKSLTLTTTPGPITLQSQILEIKTRGHWKKDKEDTVAEEFPKLWLAQIQHMVVAYHNNGSFASSIPVLNVRDRVRRFEQDTKHDLSYFAALLWRILGIVKGMKDGGKGVELVRTGDGDLKVLSWGEGTAKVLSEGLEGRWIAGKKTATGGKVKEEDVEEGGGGVDLGVEGWGEDGEKDYTECSAACGYCGECKRKVCSE